MVPYDLPKPALDMINRFLNNQNFKDYLPSPNNAGFRHDTSNGGINTLKNMIPIL